MAIEGNLLFYVSIFGRNKNRYLKNITLSGKKYQLMGTMVLKSFLHNVKQSHFLSVRLYLLNYAAEFNAVFIVRQQFKRKGSKVESERKKYMYAHNVNFVTTDPNGTIILKLCS